mmetsp:Transcript_7855/g.33048  ORF Transcript_7855/g.33048 Transcript_7855/m.33048 type:complete len:390 (-) Transcript_7855:283-1452(-)
MECVIPEKTIKLFVQILQCLAKIDDTVRVVPREHQVLLRCINSSHSCFTNFALERSFFETYDLHEDFGVIQIPLKPCLAIFKTLGSIISCTMSVDLDECRVVFNISCKLGIKKVYKLAFEDIGDIAAKYSIDDCPSKISCRARLFTEALQHNFHSSLERITLVVERQKLMIKSYDESESSMEARKLIQTELTLDGSDFEDFVVRMKTSLTLCVKEFKAFVSFCEHVNQTANIHFDVAGKPVVIRLPMFWGMIAADLVLATTVVDGNDRESMQGTPSSSGITPIRRRPSSGSSRHSNMGSQLSSMGSQPSSAYSPYPSPAYTPLSPAPSAANTSFDEEAAAMVDAAAAAYAEAAGHVSGSDDEDAFPQAGALNAKSSLFASSMYDMEVDG